MSGNAKQKKEIIEALISFYKGETRKFNIIKQCAVDHRSYTEEEVDELRTLNLSIAEAKKVLQYVNFDCFYHVL